MKVNAFEPGPARRALGLCGLCLLVAAGCKLKAEDSGVDLGDTSKKDIDDAIEEAKKASQEIEICPGFTLAELLMADALSEECREELLSFLPQPQNDFKGRLIAPGGARVDASGEVRVLLQGADAQGAALAEGDLVDELQLRVVGADGEVALDADDFEITATTELDADLMSISVVNDYSASMFERDLDDVEALERDLFECLPAVHETQVLRFSETVQTAIDFSTDRTAVLAALGPDPDFDRSSTALFDATGQAAEALGARERPVKLVIISTDGRENASKDFMEAQLLAALDDNDVFVVVFGALLADVPQLRKLAQGRGVYFYTREFKSLAAAAEPFCDSLTGLIEVRIPEAAADAEAVVLKSGELELRLELR
jgi:von Willebrand factor type A domain